jgi:predicted ester cyclase
MRSSLEAAVSESNEDVVRRVYEYYNRGDWDRFDGVVGGAYAHHNNSLTLNLSQFKRGAAWIRAGIPDFRIDIEDMVAGGDKVAVRFVGRGTHLGSLYGETPTSKSIALYGIVIYRVQDGMIAEDWEALDEGDLMKQIGALPPDA